MTDFSLDLNEDQLQIQKWVHDLGAFEGLPIGDQEAVIGRTRADSTELDEAQMPATSHVSRNVVEDDSGEELHIYRRNTPFASVGEARIPPVGEARITPVGEAGIASGGEAGIVSGGEARVPSVGEAGTASVGATGTAPVGEIGTLFIGCSADPGRIDTMLSRMFGTSGDGLIDHLIRYSTPVTGSYYFVPAMDDLTDVFGSLAPGDGSDI